MLTRVAEQGINAYGRNCELNIAEMDVDGNISGIYSDLGDSNHKNAYSYYVTGKINRDTLEITLEAGNIIGEKPYAIRDKFDRLSQITA